MINIKKVRTFSLIFFIVLAFFIFKYLTAEQVILSTESPNSKYIVKLFQQRSYIIMNKYVSFNVIRENKEYVEKKLLFVGDLLDDDFITRYPNHFWISESILMIGNQTHHSQADQIQILNKGTQSIKYLLIETYIDKFVVFDIAPGQIINLDFHYYGRLSVEGEINDSGESFGAAIRIPEENKSSENKNFSIILKENEIFIENFREKTESLRCCAVDRPYLK